MSFVTVPEFPFPRYPENFVGPPTISAATVLDINGVGQYVASIQHMPSTQTIDRVFFRIAAATTGCDCLARLETVDTSTGLPTGTLIHADASQSVTIASGAADYTVTFPGTFSIAKGALFAFVIAQSAGTPSGIQLAYFADDGGQSIGLPYCIDFDASAAFRNLYPPVMGLGVSGGGAVSIPKMWPINAVGTTSFDAADSPDTVGNRIVLSAPIRASGAWVYIDADGPGTAKLYDTDGATVLGSCSIHTNVPPSTNPHVAFLSFSTSIELVAGTYYLAVEGTDGSLVVGIAYCDFPDAGWREGSPMGGHMQYATCTQTPTSTASWTVTDTRQAFMGLLIDGISDGAGGGGETSHTFAS